MPVLLVDWISDTHSQGYIILQSLVRWITEILHQIQYAVNQGCVRLRHALNPDPDMPVE